MAENRSAKPSLKGVSDVRRNFQNKFVNQKLKTPVKSKAFTKNRSSKITNGFIQKWVPKAANNVSAASLVSIANQKGAADSVNTVNKVSTAPEDSTAKPETTPIISTKFSSHEIPQSADSQNSKFKEFAYVDANGQPKTTQLGFLKVTNSLT